MWVGMGAERMHSAPNVGNDYVGNAFWKKPHRASLDAWHSGRAQARERSHVALRCEEPLVVVIVVAVGESEDARNRAEQVGEQRRLLCPVAAWDRDRSREFKINYHFIVRRRKLER